MPVILTSTLPRPSALKLTDVALMREVGHAAIEMIRTRTRMGRGTNGPLRPYAPAYAARKAKEGLSTSPNLTVSGDMLDALKIVHVTDTSVTLGWDRSETR